MISPFQIVKLLPFEIMSEKYLLNEITYSFIASIHVGGGGGKPNIVPGSIAIA